MRRLTRTAILDAARTVFARHGLEGASMRLIAQECGYTAGALYNHFPSKETIYAELVQESLARLKDSLEAAADRAPAGDDAAALREVVAGLHRFYADHPRDLEMSLYLANGLGRKGLTPELDRRLNAHLTDAIAVIRTCLGRARPDLDEAGVARAVTLVQATCMGSAVLAATGRLRVFGASGKAVVDDLAAMLNAGPRA